MTQTAKINEAILSELRKQAEQQSKRNYKAVEVDCRTLLAMIREIKNSRIVNMQYEWTNAVTPID